MMLRDSIAGCILGTALGDSIGLPAEGLSRQRQQRLFPKLDGHRLFFGHGMVSDDTEHTCLVAEALCASGGDGMRFQSELEARLRSWLLGLPAGVGFATLRAILKLWLGLRPSGVFSAGNGPAMRSALLGVCYPTAMRELVRASTQITHTDPKAEWAAYAVALAAHMAQQCPLVDPLAYRMRIGEAIGDEDFLGRIDAVVKSGQSTEAFANNLGLSRGVSGYCYHSVPVALHAWLHHQGNFRETVLAAIHCGGDTDTTGAIAGAIAGAQCGVEALPRDWLDGLWEWPRTVTRMMELSDSLADAVGGESSHPHSTPVFAATFARNAVFTTIVVGHIVRRMIPL